MSKLPSDAQPPTSIAVELPEVPENVDRRAFLMRSAVIGATAVITGRTVSAAADQARPPRRRRRSCARPSRRRSTSSRRSKGRS